MKVITFAEARSSIGFAPPECVTGETVADFDGSVIARHVRVGRERCPCLASFDTPLRGCSG
jgi:hypothetical protein